MDGFHRINPTLISILTLWMIGYLKADQLSVSANEPACHREKISTEVSKTPFRSIELPATLISHKCDGDRCYVIEDEPTCDGHHNSSSTVTQLAAEELDAIFQSDSAPPVVTSPLGHSRDNRSCASQPTTDSRPQVSIEKAYVELRVMNSELVARLEMTQAILELQNHYTDQIVLLERQNAKLVAEAAELRVKNEVNEQLTAGLIERTELTAKLSSAHDWISSRTAYEATIPVQSHPSAFVAHPSYDETIASIQEDLSNLRRQLPLLKRTPVPFAVSNSVSREPRYVPLGSKIEATNSTIGQCPSTEEADSPCREAAVKNVGAR